MTFYPNRRAALRALGGILLVAALIAGVLLALFGGVEGFCAAVKYATVLRVIGRDYVADYDIAALTDQALYQAVSSLDSWSYYMNADTYEAYRSYEANSYQGIGVTIMKDDETGGFLIVETKPDGPAQQAGLEAGDIILAVDGVSVTEEDTAFLRELIAADYGKDAMITLLRADGSREDVAVSCRVVYSSPVSYSLLEDDVGYIAIENFREGAGGDAVDAVRSLVEQGARGLVFDVRGNPGGFVSELVELLDYLLPEGDIFIRADKNGVEQVERSDADCVELPMAVLVNAQSYSAAEFFAAALQEYRWGVVVGQATTGKARSQITVELSDGSAVHLSKYTYLTPLRNDLYEAGGIVPSVVVELDDEQSQALSSGLLAPEDDPQLRAALDTLS